MKEKLCDICKKKVPMIHNGDMDLCLDCHNEKQLKKMGIKDTYNYIDNVSVTDLDGSIRSFKMHHIVLGAIVSWDAQEINGNYHFHHISDVNEEGCAVAKEFYRKIEKGVCTKTIEKVDTMAPNLLRKNGNTLALKSKGTIEIVENGPYDVQFSIDGELYSPQEFGSMLGAYPGFILQYQIQDASEDLLEDDTYLVPLKISQDILVKKLENAIEEFSDYGFISYDDIHYFDEIMLYILQDLEIMEKRFDRGTAVDTGMRLIELLSDLETDDDYFPEYHINDIHRICKFE